MTYCAFLSSETTYKRILITENDHAPEASGYLVYSDKCKIPEYDVYDPRVMRYIFYSEYSKCSGQEPLTAVSYNYTLNKYEIFIQSEYITQYTYNGIQCSFRGIIKCDNYESDDCSDYSEPITIEHDKALIPLEFDHVRAECYDNGYKVYDNVHPTVPDKPQVKSRLKKWKGKGKPISVLFLGIDTMSRMNFIRTMPKTAKYIYEETNGWYQFNGYNKVS